MGNPGLMITKMPVEQLRKRPLGKLSLVSDELKCCLFSICKTDREECHPLQVSGLLQIMIRLAQGETCNNELTAKLRECLN